MISVNIKKWYYECGICGNFPKIILNLESEEIKLGISRNLTVIDYLKESQAILS